MCLINPFLTQSYSYCEEMRKHTFNTCGILQQNQRFGWLIIQKQPSKWVHSATVGSLSVSFDSFRGCCWWWWWWCRGGIFFISKSDHDSVSKWNSECFSRNYPFPWLALQLRFVGSLECVVQLDLLGRYIFPPNLLNKWPIFISNLGHKQQQQQRVNYRCSFCPRRDHWLCFW